VSFPWETLITAAATLIAGWGGISLKDRLAARRARQDRRRAAYLELMLRLDDLRRIFGAPHTVDEGAFAGTIGKAAGQAAREIQRAYFSVFLVAPRDVQALAGAAWDNAWKIHDWLDSGDPRPADLNELKNLLVAFRAASMTFATAARTAEGGHLPLPAMDAERSPGGRDDGPNLLRPER
jgi:hypothetical protein